ncbi:MAG: ATP-binding protein, partial [Firmicutes bacterium]|nr:ATP-binding protein [Bacillota bacterium]
MSKTLNKKDTLVVNLYGGPGAGKSTNAAALFVELKNRGINCELVREYAKDLVWEERSVEFYDQFTVLGKQVKRVNALIGKVDIIITDSPIILSCHYNTLHNKQCFDKIVLDLHNTYK